MVAPAPVVVADVEIKNKKIRHTHGCLKDSQRAETFMFLPFLYTTKILFVMPTPFRSPTPSGSLFSSLASVSAGRLPPAISAPFGVDSTKGALPLLKPQKTHKICRKKAPDVAKGAGLA